MTEGSDAESDIVRDPGVGTFMLAALVVVGVVVGAIALVVFVFTLS